jgi:dTDP-4-dehydrorhamnose reductase
VSGILILGGSGMLGHKMFQVLGARFADISCTIRGKTSAAELRRVELFQSDSVIPEVDVTDVDRLAALLSDLTPDVVVNCVGIVKQRDTARDAIPSITVNSLLPHHLAAICETINARLIHFSTDCVFSGDKGAYTEDDPSDARDLYGRTKFLGEVHGPAALTLRTSMIGRELTHRSSLLEWFLAQDGQKVKGYRKALYAGLTTNRMAYLVGAIIEHHPDLTGLFHVAGPWIPKYDLLVQIRDAFGLSIEIESDDEVVIDRTLDGSRFAAATGFSPPTWQEMVTELANDPTPYESWGR